MRRLRQITVAIRQREFLSQASHRRLLSWQTRTLAQFIAATVRVEAGQENPLAEAALKVTLDEREREELATAQRVAADTPVENAPGSYERFMAAFASGGGGPR